MAGKRLFIVDAMAMAFRNYHAFAQRPLKTSRGLETSAVYGSAQFLLKLIEDEKPDYLVIATDSREKTFRHELYGAYKANRSQMPEELAVQIPYLFRLFDAMGLSLAKEPGLEADDLIGTMVRRYEEEGMQCFIVSGDKDFMQLIDDRVSLYSPKKGGEVVKVGPKEVYEKFGCQPEQVIDILALIGDTSDNVPGVPGIGDKGAAKLIQEYGSLDGIYASLEGIANKRQREALEQNRELAYLSRQLVTIKTDGELHFRLEELACDPSHALTSRPLLELFEELEFRLLADKIRRRIGAESQAKAEPAQAAEPTESAGEHQEYRLVNTPSTLTALLDELKEADTFCFDTETTGLDIVTDRPIGMSFSTRAHTASYVPLVDRQLDGLTAREVLDRLKPVLTDPTKLKVGHNMKFDLQMLANVELTPVGPFADTMIIAYLLESTIRSHGLDACCLKYLNYVKIPTSALIGKDAARSMLDVDLDIVTRYACEDADLTLRLYHCLRPNLERAELTKVFETVEMPLVPILARMEQTGVFLDSDVLHEISEDLDVRAKDLTAKIYELAGEEFNINSTKQLQVILFEKLAIHEQLGVKRLKKTKSGYSTDVSVLEALAEHPLPRALLEYRSVTKLKSTYVDTLPQLISAKSGRLHTSFHQTGTATGRLSSSDPNLQNIPIRSELGREIRKAFRPENPDCVILSADYSQVELRLLAHIAKEENLANAFRSGADIHTATAAHIFGVEPTAVTPNQRSAAKAINFGIIYGMGPQRLARETGVKTSEAKAFIDKYFETYPGIDGYIKSAIAFAREHQYTVTMTGRRRPLPEINNKDRLTQANAQNIAVNSPVQGSAADLIKLAMIQVQKMLDESRLNARMLLQVHDELVFECPKSEVEAVSKLVVQGMESAMTLDVPLKVEVGFGANWLEAH